MQFLLKQKSHKIFKTIYGSDPRTTRYVDRSIRIGPKFFGLDLVQSGPSLGSSLVLVLVQTWFWSSLGSGPSLGSGLVGSKSSLVQSSPRANGNGRWIHDFKESKNIW